jgi:hypothetical protein
MPPRTHRPRTRLLATGIALAALLLASQAPAQDDDPPRQDIRMGNTDNMRMGRDAQGNVVMEVRRPPKQDTAPQNVGPFFIYPQVGLPQQGQTSGQQQGGWSGSGQTGQTGQSGQMGQGMPYGTGQTTQPNNTMIYRPGQAPVTIPGGAGGPGQSGRPIIYRPGTGS